MPINLDDTRGPDDYEDWPRALHRLLERIGVDTHFWESHAHRIETHEAKIRKIASEAGLEGWHPTSPMDLEDDSEELRQLNKNLRKYLAEEASEFVSEAHSSSAEEIISAIKEGVDFEDADAMALHLLPARLVLFGDGFSVQGRTDAAMGLYSLAVDLAPTPQSQMEVGYLLASRGSVRFPGFWTYVEAGHSPAILLLPDTFMHHPGLLHFEVVYEELLPGPPFADSMAVLRLALEAYGRVFAYCYPEDQAGQTSESSSTPFLGAFVVDGLHTLLAEIDTHDMNLVWACLYTLFEWAGGARGVSAVEDRLRFSESYLYGYEDGRVAAQTAEKVDVNLRRTQIVDPVEFRRELARELARVPLVERADVREVLKQRFGADWSRISESVRWYLELGEWQLRGEKQRGAWDFRSPLRTFADAAESAVRDATGMGGRTLGEFARAPQVRAWLRGCLTPGAPADSLAVWIQELADLDNPRSHGQNPPVRTNEGQADHAKELACRIIGTLVKHRKPRD